MSSLHVHHETVDVHDDCLQCAGHFDTAHHHNPDCQYCTFLGLNYLVQDDGQTAVLFPATELTSTPTPATMPQFRCGIALLRAPPVA